MQWWAVSTIDIVSKSITHPIPIYTVHQYSRGTQMCPYQKSAPHKLWRWQVIFIDWRCTDIHVYSVMM